MASALSAWRRVLVELSESFQKAREALEVVCGAAYVVCLLCTVDVLRAKDAFDAAFNAFH